MNENDIARLNLHEGDMVTLSTAVDDGVSRRLGGLRVIPYGIPEKCIAGYYPECNVLIPLWHYAKKSKVPAAKSVPVRIELQNYGPRKILSWSRGEARRQGRAVLILVEIDINRAALGAPRLALLAPTVQSAT
jgi:hypothetical protein